MTQEQQRAPELPSMIDAPDEGDRPSITETNGTVARFEMAFDPSPKDRFAFSAPIWQRAPSFVFLGFAMVLGLTVVAGTHASSNSALFRWVADHPFAQPGSLVVLICAVAVVVRAALRGVIVTREGIETRDLVGTIPRVRKWRWSQIDRLVLDEEDVMLELWNGTYEKLPKVQHPKELADLLERIAAARGRPVTRLAKTS